MKKLIQIMVLGALMLFSPYSNAALTNVDKQFIEKIESLENGGFENGKAGWTASSPATFSLVTGSSALVGSTSARFNASATAQTVCSKLYTVPKGVQGLPSIGFFKYITAENTNKYNVVVRDGSSNIISTNALDPRTYADFAYAPFAAPTSGTFKLCLESTGSAVAIDFDFGHLGSDTRLSDISQAKLLGSIKISGCSTDWTQTSTSYASFGGSPTGCIFTTSGAALAPSSNLPAIKFASVPAGVIKLEYEGGIQNPSNTNMKLQFTDGTTTAYEESYVAGSSSTTEVFPGISQHMPSYQGGSNVTFEIKSKVTANTGQLYGSSTPAVIRVWLFPSSTETGVRVDQLGWHVDASISGANVSLGTSVVSSYTGLENSGLTLTNNTGNAVIAAQIPCSSTNAASGTTCSAGNESLGVVFNVPSAGDIIACATFSHQIVAAGVTDATSLFQVNETTNSTQTVIQEGKGITTSGLAITAAGSAIVNPHRTCGVLSMSSSGLKTLRLMYRQPNATAITTSQILSIGSPHTVHWEVYPTNYLSGAMPIMQGMVSSGTNASAPRLRIEYAVVSTSCSVATCTIASGNGSGWLTNITRSGAGAYSANFSSSWSAIPSCFPWNWTGNRYMIGLTSPTVNAYTFQTNDSADTNFNIMCIGLR